MREWHTAHNIDEESYMIIAEKPRGSKEQWEAFKKKVNKACRKIAAEIVQEHVQRLRAGQNASDKSSDDSTDDNSDDDNDDDDDFLYKKSQTSKKRKISSSSGKL